VETRCGFPRTGFRVCCFVVVVFRFQHHSLKNEKSQESVCFIIIKLNTIIPKPKCVTDPNINFWYTNSRLFCTFIKITIFSKELSVTKGNSVVIVNITALRSRTRQYFSLKRPDTTRRSIPIPIQRGSEQLSQEQMFPLCKARNCIIALCHRICEQFNPLQAHPGT